MFGSDSRPNRHLIAAALAAALFALAPASAEAGCSKSVVLYNASWCPYCQQVRAILARNHIKYSIMDATTPQVQAIMLRKFGDTAVPRTVIGGVVVEGVDEARIKQLCRGSPEGRSTSITTPEFPQPPHDGETRAAAAAIGFPASAVP
jgi:glutaredoxin